MNKFRVKTLINYIIEIKSYSKNINKYEEKCTQIYILHNNRDDDELIIESIKEQIYKENKYKENKYKENKYKENKYNIESPMLSPICLDCIDIKCFCSYKT